MCPSCHCPSCGKKTYHKALCENPNCGFDPLDSPPVATPESIISSLERFDLVVVVIPKPFPVARIQSRSHEKIEQFASAIGYTGPIWQLEVDDMFSPRTVFSGIDLAKHLGQPLIDRVRGSSFA